MSTAGNACHFQSPYSLAHMRVAGSPRVAVDSSNRTLPPSTTISFSQLASVSKTRSFSSQDTSLSVSPSTSSVFSVPTTASSSSSSSTSIKTSSRSSRSAASSSTSSSPRITTVRHSTIKSSSLSTSTSSRITLTTHSLPTISASSSRTSPASNYYTTEASNMKSYTATGTLATTSPIYLSSSWLMTPTTYTSQGGWMETSHSSSPASSGILSTNSADGSHRSGFSRNTRAIIGVAVASGITIIVAAILIFIGCRRLRLRRMRDGNSSNRHLTSHLERSGSLRSPIDGDEPETSGLDAGAFTAIGGVKDLEQFHFNTLPVMARHPLPGQIHDLANPYGPQSVSFPSTTADGDPALEAPPPTHVSKHSSPFTPPIMNTHPGKEDVALPSYADRLRGGGLMADISPSLPAQPSTAGSTTQPWLYRRASGSNQRADSFSGLTQSRPQMQLHLPTNPFHSREHPSPPTPDTLSGSDRSREDSITRIPEGLLHPLLAERLGLGHLGSVRSLMDNVDYSRPIGGIVHARVDSTTTFTTQATEADVGHDSDLR